MSSIRFIRLCAVLAVFATVGCANERDEPRTQSATEPPGAAQGSNGDDAIRRSEEPPLRAPMVLDVDGPSTVTSSSEIEVHVEIRRAAVTTLPVALSVQVPDGATVLDGAVSETIRSTSTQAISRRLVLRLDRIPDQDLIVRATIQAGGFGAHAERRYRFGRPARKLVQPRRVGSSIPLH